MCKSIIKMTVYLAGLKTTYIKMNSKARMSFFIDQKWSQNAEAMFEKRIPSLLLPQEITG